MRYILIGPPGSGKSTLCKFLGGIDLEDFPESRRLDVLEVNRKYFGGAHISRHTVPSDCKKVLLYLPQNTYEQRRQQRDACKPGKALQRHHTMADWVSCADYVLDASGPIDVVATRLRNRVFLDKTLL